MCLPSAQEGRTSGRRERMRRLLGSTRGRTERAGMRFTAGHQPLFSREQRVKPLAEPGRRAKDCHR